MASRGAAIRHIPDDEQAIERISRQFVAACSRNGLTPLTSAVDRHGSLVWEAGKHAALNRFVTLAITDTSPGLLIELWIIADDNEHYTRRLIEQSLVASAGSLAEFGDGAPAVERMVARAVEAVAALSRDDLTETYPVPHGPGAAGAVLPAR